MHENYKYTYLKIDEIETKAKKENISISILQLEDGKVVFFPAWTFSLNNGILTAESSYDKFSIAENEYDKLIKKAEQQALLSAIKNSKNIKKELYLYLLYRLYYNWVLNSIIFDYEKYAWKIHLSSSAEKICWDKRDKFIGFETTKYVGIFNIKPKIKTVEIPLKDSTKIAEKIIALCFNQDKRQRGRIASQYGAVIQMEQHPEDKKRLDKIVSVERLKEAKKQMAKPYEGFSFEEHIRWECSIYYKQDGKLIIAYGDYALKECGLDKKCPYYYVCIESSFEKWVYPEERLLASEEKQQLLSDMDEYNKNNSKKTLGFVKPVSIEELMDKHKNNK